jgi:hypothetical protein
MKATKEDAIRLVSDWFTVVIKDKEVKPFIGEFDGYELIAKGHAIIDIVNRGALNKNQKIELVEMIKSL